MTNTIRWTGMNSGIDTDALVKAMTMNQQKKVDALDAKRTQAEWKRDLMTDFNNKLRIFRDTYGSVLGSDSLMSRAAFSSFNIKMAENSGVNISVSATAKAGSYHIRVGQIATAASMKGSSLTGRTTGLTDAEINSTSVSDLPELSGGRLYQSPDIHFSINGKDFIFSSGASLRQIMNEVNGAGIGVNMAYSQATDSSVVTKSCASGG